MYNHCMEDGRTASTVEFHKVTVNLIPKAWEAANLGAGMLGMSRTDVINRAVQAYVFLEQTRAAGSEIFVRAPDGSITQVQFL